MWFPPFHIGGGGDTAENQILRGRGTGGNQISRWGRGGNQITRSQGDTAGNQIPWWEGGGARLGTRLHVGWAGEGAGNQVTGGGVGNQIPWWAEQSIKSDVREEGHSRDQISR